MELVLDQEQLHFSGMNNRLKELPARISFRDLSQKRKNAVEWKYRVNGSKPQKLEDNEIVAKWNDLRKGSLKVELIARNKSTGEETTYESEELSVMHYAGFGTKIEKAYPDAIADLKSEIRDLKEQVKKLEEEGDLL